MFRVPSTKLTQNEMNAQCPLWGLNEKRRKTPQRAETTETSGKSPGRKRFRVGLEHPAALPL